MSFKARILDEFLETFHQNVKWLPKSIHNHNLVLQKKKKLKTNLITQSEIFWGLHVICNKLFIFLSQL